MVVMVTYKSGYINSNILETSKDTANIPPSLKQRVHELVGGPLNPPPPPLGNVTGEQKAYIRKG